VPPGAASENTWRLFATCLGQSGHNHFMSHPIRLLAGLSLLAAQPDAAWRDRSPHETRFVTVDSSVRLEVLDWAGARRPILFVGCYLTAHVYDDIAPKLTDQFHMFAVTRRGVGASESPGDGARPAAPRGRHPRGDWRSRVAPHRTSEWFSRAGTPGGRPSALANSVAARQVRVANL
jgi:hypothetical protein